MNIRRAIPVTALAAALILAPTVAMAYEADDFTVSVSTPTPVVGSPFQVTVTGPVGNPTITLTISSPDVPESAITIAGTKALSKPTTDGAATFAVTLSQPGNFALVATDANGTTLSSQTISAVSSDTAGGNTAGGGGGGVSADGGSGALPRTGSSDVLMLVSGAGVLVAAGVATVVLASKRRKRADV